MASAVAHSISWEVSVVVVICCAEGGKKLLLTVGPVLVATLRVVGTY